MQKAVVDDLFKSEILKDKDPRVQQAAAEASDLVKNDGLWSSLDTYVALMSPVAKVLDPVQGDLRGVGVVYAFFTRLLKHYSSFPFPGDEAGKQLKAHCLRMLQQGRAYLMRPIHLLGYLLDPRYVHDTAYPTDEEIKGASDVIRQLARAHDVRSEMLARGTHVDSELPQSFPAPTRDGISADYAKFRAKMGGSLSLEAVWEPNAVADSLAW